MNVHTTELGGKRLLRVAEIEEPDGRTTVVVDLRFRSDGIRSLLEPGADQRLTLDSEEVGELRTLLGEVG